MTKRWLTVLGVAMTCACGPMGPEPMDAGVGSDAGLSMDAGTVTDAGMRADAGVSPDAGASVDAGTSMDAGVSATDGGVRFSTDVAPVLGVCLSCHSDRNTFAEVRARVTPGDPARSTLYQRITSQGRPMPPGGPLSTSNPEGTARIEAWIRAGALDN